MAKREHIYEELDLKHTDVYLEVPAYELLQEHLNAKFAELVIFAMDHKTSKLRLKGSPAQIENAATYIASISEHIVKSRYTDNNFLEEFLRSTDLRQFSQKHFRENGIEAVCASDGNEVYIWSLEDHLEKAHSMLKKAFTSWPFPLTKQHARIVSGEDWSRFLKKLEHTFSGSSMNSCKFTIVNESDESLACIYIAGNTPTVYQAERELANFFKQHTDGETTPVKNNSPSTQVVNHKGLNNGAEFSELQNGTMGNSSPNNEFPLYATVNKPKQLKAGAEFSELQGGSVDDSRLNDKDYPLYATVNTLKELPDGAELSELGSGSVDSSRLNDKGHPLYAEVNNDHKPKNGARFKEIGNGYVEIDTVSLNEERSHEQVNKRSGQNIDQQFKYDPLYEDISFSEEDKSEASKDGAQSSDMDAHLTRLNPILKDSLLHTHILPGGRFLYLHIGDMVVMPVDAVVNAANERLNHMGGIAGALSDAAGPNMQRESNDHIKRHGKVPFGYVVTTGSGRLPCRKVFHVVGPNWRNQENNTNNGRQGIRRLNMAIESALEAGDREGFKSIALPAISSGIYGFPLPLCAKTIYKAILVYCKKTQDSPHTLTDIHVVDTGDEFVIEMMNLTQENNDDVILAHDSSDYLGTKYDDSKTQEHKVFSKSGLPQNEGFVNDKGKHRGLVAPIEDVNEENKLRTSEGITIIIATGNLEDQNTDVIVNTMPPNWDLRTGSVSSAIARKGGADLQAAVDKKILFPFQNHFETESTGALSCKRVYHVFLELAYRESSNENYNKLNKAVVGCLKRAHKAQMRSISFPVMGSGKQGYPLQDVAQCMLHAVISFSEQHKTTTLQLIQIVTLSSDSDVLPMFQREIFSLKKFPQRIPNNNGRHRKPFYFF